MRASCSFTEFVPALDSTIQNVTRSSWYSVIDSIPAGARITYACVPVLWSFCPVDLVAALELELDLGLRPPEPFFGDPLPLFAALVAAGALPSTNTHLPLSCQALMAAESSWPLRVPNRLAP